MKRLSPERTNQHEKTGLARKILQAIFGKRDETREEYHMSLSIRRLEDIVCMSANPLIDAPADDTSPAVEVERECVEETANMSSAGEVTCDHRDTQATDTAFEHFGAGTSQPNVVYQDDLGTAQTARDFFTEHTTIFDKVEAGVHNGRLELNEKVLFTSKQEFVPSEENPLEITLDFIPGKDEDALVIYTRSDGETEGARAQLKRGVSFVVEQKDVHVWERTHEGDAQGVAPSATIDHLEAGKVYKVQISDNGTEARLILKDGDRVIADLSGTTTHNFDGNDQHIVFTNGNFSSRAGVAIDNIRITYGTEEVSSLPLSADTEDDVCIDCNSTEVQQKVFQTVDATFETFTGRSISTPVAQQSEPVEEAEEDSSISELHPRNISIQNSINTLELQKADLETRLTRVEMMTVVPSISASTDAGSNMITINYKNVPADFELLVWHRKNGNIALQGMSGGSGTLRIPFLSDQTQYVTLNEPDGNQTLLFQIETNGVTWTKPDVGDHLGTFAHEVESTDVNQEVQVEIDDIDEQIHQLERSKIPYSAMHVSPSSANPSSFEVHFMSNHKESYFEVYLEGEPGHVLSHTEHHEDGEPHGTLSFDMGRLAVGGNGGQVEIRMYSDREKTQLLDVFKEGSYRPKEEGKVVRGESRWTWGEMEMGRTVDSPHETMVSVAAISGPNILLNVRSPYDSSIVTLDGGGMFATKTIEHTGGTEMSSILLTFNTDNESGDYDVHVVEGRNGMQVTGKRLTWNKEAGQLSLVDDNAEMGDASDADANEANMEMQRQFAMRTEVAGRQLTIESVRNNVQSHLYENSRFYIDADDAIDYIRGSSWEGHPDAGATFSKGLGAWQTVMQNVLHLASNVAVAAWTGDSQADALGKFYTMFPQYTSSPTLRSDFVGAFGVQIPSAEEVLMEGIRLAEASVEKISGAEGKQARNYDRIDNLNGAGGGESGASLTEAQQVSSSTSRISTEAITHQVNSILEAHAGNPESASQVLSNYLARFDTGDRARVTAIIADAGVVIDTTNPVLVATAGENDGGVIVEGIETFDGDAKLDRWWATAGEGPIGATWTVEVEEAGEYRLQISGYEKWNFDSAQLIIDGKGYDVQNGLSEVITLTKGVHKFSFRDIGVPEQAVVEEINFTLRQNTSMGPVVRQDFDTAFIADHPEVDANQTFRINANGNEIQIKGVQQLIERFAPILHYNEGEDFPMPFPIENYTVPTDGNANAEIDISSTPANVTPTMYASVVQDGNKLAINYHFFYPMSNWGDEGGHNNHEGDWEGVTVFLNQDNGVWSTDGIALAQHINLGTAKGGSFVGNWEGVDGTHPNIFVSLGGHASYSTSGTFSVGLGNNDVAEGTGNTIWPSSSEIKYLPRVGSGNSELHELLRFPGYWGDEDLEGIEDEAFNASGDQAPQGPVFTSNNYKLGLRWMDPFIWADNFR